MSHKKCKLLTQQNIKNDKIIKWGTKCLKMLVLVCLENLWCPSTKFAKGTVVMFLSVTNNNKHVKRRDQGTPVPMNMGGTKSKAVVKESGVNNSPTFCSFQKITQVTQMSVTTSNTIPGTVLVQDEHLAWAEPSLYKHRCGLCRCISHNKNSPTPRTCQNATHQATEGVIEPVVQREPLHHLKKRGVVKATGVSGDKFIHAMFLSSVSVYQANSTGGEKTRFR